MSDHPSNGSDQDRLAKLDLAADKSYHAQPEEWRKRISEFQGDAAARCKAEDEANKVLERAARAIAEERTAVQAGTAAPRLTDPDPKHRPGKGWEWRTEFTDDEDRDEEVGGWMPPEAVKAEDFLAGVAMRRRYGPGPNPSLATMFVVLADAHDQYLSDSVAILPPVTGKRLGVAEVLQSQDRGTLDLWRVRMDLRTWQTGSPDWLATLESYSNAVEAHLKTLECRDVTDEIAGMVRLYVEDIDNFSLVRDVKPSMVACFLKDGCMDVAENAVKMALEQILDVPFHRKDSPGELDDIYTANVIVRGRPHATAFLLKGPGIGTKEMDIKHCGSKGNQLVRLFDAPAELFVIQFTGRIAEMVVKDVEGKVTARRAQGKPAQFLIMEGQDTARVLHAYGKL